MPPNRSNKPGKDSDSLVGKDDTKINDSVYTERVKERLKKSVIDILRFSNGWRAWIVDHSYTLPVLDDDKPLAELFSNDKKLDSLFRALIAHIKSKKKFPKHQRKIIRDIMIHIISLNDPKVTKESLMRIDDILR